jgi:HK97 family phage major capsid protein
MDLKTERKNTIAHADQIVARAKTAGRDMTPTEVASVEAAITRIEELDKQLKGRALVDSVMKLGTSDGFTDGGPGSLFSGETKAGFISAVKTRSAFRADVDRKAITVGGLVPAAGSGVEPGLHPTAVYALADLFRNQPAEGPVQRYYRVTSGSAAVVPEGTQKPDSGTTVAPVDVTLKKIATTSKISDELSQDAAYLVGYLQSDLAAAVLAAENAEIVSSLTASGILTDTGAATTVIDMVSEAVAAQESISGLTPSAVIVNPTTLATIRAMKASTSGVYHVDPWTAGPPSLHGLKLVSTPAVAADTVWVASSESVVIFRRGGIQVETGLDGEDFTFNLRTIRCEERMASAVVRPSGIVKITLT